MQAIQAISSTKQHLKHEKQSPFLCFVHLLILLLLVTLYTFPYLVDSNLWLSHYNDYILALDYIREHGFQLAPKIADNTYLKEFPFAFWGLGAFAILLPHLSNAFLLISFYIASLFIFACSVYVLGYALFFSSKIALCASAIALTSFFALSYMPLAGYDLYFVAFANLSLAFAFRAYIRPVAPIFLFLAFVFMICGFLAGGFFVFALRIMTSTLFLILCGNFSRFNKNDVYFYTFSFLIVLALLFILFYTAGHREYVALLADFDTFKKALEDWQLAKHAVYYLLAILFVFLPYIFILFFINVPNVFAPLLTAIRSLVEKFNRRTKKSAEANEEKFEENYENDLDSENSYATIQIDSTPDYSYTSKIEESQIEAEEIDTAQEQKEKNRKANLASLFLFSILISGLTLLCLFPVSTFTYVLFLSPAFSLLFANQLFKLSPTKSKLFFSLVAWLVMCIGIITIACGILPELKLLYPSLFTNLPDTLLAVLLDPSRNTFFLCGALIIAVSLILLFTDKSNSLISLLRLVFLLILLSRGLNSILFAQIDIQVSASQQVEITN